MYTCIIKHTCVYHNILSIICLSFALADYRNALKCREPLPALMQMSTCAYMYLISFSLFFIASSEEKSTPGGGGRGKEIYTNEIEVI